ncbi:MAG: hypothetical protein E5Y67_00910 [Mesorhizobium sp.]|uniref:hypothetical protein n=1 Tax=Mesorhizobium sp. TaxID=1871066 RepID=UPI001207251C|nr:hypothetical protein [Mesorhizobium sp.]TIM16808.1 MAG: hypothetical protein E5Y67_00910 [Mesorhizobium sp.]
MGGKAGVDIRRDLLAAFAAKLSPSDIVVIEATGNATPAAAVVAPRVNTVVIANPNQVRIIAHAKISVVAHPYATGTDQARSTLALYRGELLHKAHRRLP